MTTTTTDCLVLKIEEYLDTSLLDTTLFILYDKNQEVYLIRGKRRDLKNKNVSVPYSFYCKHASDLFDLISMLTCESSKLSFTLYNYNDLPYFSSEIDYEYLKKLDSDHSYELVGYDNERKNKKQIIKYLRILKNVFNYY
jgi:hypothetical protein